MMISILIGIVLGFLFGSWWAGRLQFLWWPSRAKSEGVQWFNSEKAWGFSIWNLDITWYKKEKDDG